MTALTLLAPAKVNLYLHVTGKRDDGYHLLDSLTVFTEFGDILTFSASDEFSFSCTGPFSRLIDPEENHIITAAQKFTHQFKTPPHIAIHLEKNIPVGAGLGGGSADAAATLRGLTQLWNITPARQQLEDIALSIGADVPSCLHSQSVHMTGIGEILTPAPVPTCYILLINPGDFISTRDVFTQRNSATRPVHSSLPAFSTYEELITFLGKQHNDLSEPACKISSNIETVLHELTLIETCDIARVSGSGATCFGIFKHQEDAVHALNKLKLHHTEWWMHVTHTRIP